MHEFVPWRKDDYDKLTAFSLLKKLKKKKLEDPFFEGCFWVINETGGIMYPFFQKNKKKLI